MARVLVIPDLQAPFQHEKAIPFLKFVYRNYKCDTVVCIGDEVDFHTLSKYAKNPDGFSSGKELALARDFIKRLSSVFPNVRVCTANHTVRPWRRAYEAGLPIDFLPSYQQALGAPATWTWHDEIMIDNVKYIHGEEYSGANGTMKAIQDHRCNVVHGHIHSHAQVKYLSHGENNIFGMNVGCLINQKAYAFDYSKKSAYQGTIGCGVVLEGKLALFVPLSAHTA